jgi:hypothetical protein
VALPALDEGQVLAVVSAYPLGLATDPLDRLLPDRLTAASAAGTLLSLDVRTTAAGRTEDAGSVSRTGIAWRAIDLRLVA